MKDLDLDIYSAPTILILIISKLMKKVCMIDEMGYEQKQHYLNGILKMLYDTEDYQEKLVRFLVNRFNVQAANSDLR